MTHREETEALLDQWFGDDPCACACHKPVVPAQAEPPPAELAP